MSPESADGSWILMVGERAELNSNIYTNYFKGMRGAKNYSNLMDFGKDGSTWSRKWIILHATKDTLETVAQRSR